MNLEEYEQKALRNPEFRKEYERYDLAFEIGHMVLEARIKKGLTQTQLAERIKTRQSSIARLENGQKLPSLSFLEKIAQALGTHLKAPQFAFLEESKQSKNRAPKKMITAKIVLYPQKTTSHSSP